jgi:rubredoxin
MSEPVPEGFYKMRFKCANCGFLFEVNIRKGNPANGAAGICPNCGVRSGRSGIGHHEAVYPSDTMNLGDKEILHG